MPVLKDFRKQVELTLPVTKGHVWIYDFLLAQDSLEIDKTYVSDTQFDIDTQKKTAKPLSLRATRYYDALEKTIRAMVVKWDFTDEDGKPVEPTSENLMKLPKHDFEYLQSEIEKRVSERYLSEDQKKNILKS